MPRPLFALLTLAPLILAGGCSTNPATGKQSFTAFMSTEKELEVGAEEHPKILKGFGGEYGELKIRSYVRHIGKKLAALSEVPNLPYRFTILNDDKINAFALPGGYVYITRGLMALAENEAEMAGVLTHEIGHITARHSAERYSTAMATNIGLMVIGVLGSAAGLPSGIGRAVSFGAQAAIQGYSRTQELEADMLGVRYMARAGYDPNALTSFFEKMKAHSELEAAMQGKDGVSHNIMSTHPRTVDRIKQAIRLAKDIQVANPIVNRDEYLAQIDGMVFGDDPAQGVRKGRLFMHPELKIQFQIPPEFVMFNSPSQVTAIGPGKSRIIFDMEDPKKAKQVGNLATYLSRVWATSLSVSGVERLSINGLAGATGQARLNSQDGGVDVRLIAIRGAPDQIFRMAFLTKPEYSNRLNVEMRRTTYSFRRLNDEEAAAIKPLRLRTHTVKRGDTIQSLAARMPFEKFRAEWLQVLNGLRPDQILSPGRVLKVVSE